MDAEQVLFSALASRAKRMRDKVREALDHFSDLDPRFCRKVSPGQDSPDVYSPQDGSAEAVSSNLSQP